LAPIEINHTGTMQHNLSGIIGSMSLEEMQTMAAECLTMEAKAAERDQLIIDSPPRLALIKHSG
jgi:hypothetical protein